MSVDLAGSIVLGIMIILVLALVVWGDSVPGRRREGANHSFPRPTTDQAGLESAGTVTGEIDPEEPSAMPTHEPVLPPRHHRYNRPHHIAERPDFGGGCTCGGRGCYGCEH